jgi:AcrR family transcriptional regulator
MRSVHPGKRPVLGRPTLLAADELLHRIRVAARQEFIAKGFDGASIEGIAEAAGTSKLTLYRHFASKRGLFTAVIEQLVAQYAERLEGAVDISLPAQRVLLDMGLFLSASYFTPEAQSLTRMLIGERQRMEDLSQVTKRIADLARRPVESYLRLLQSRQEADFDDVRRAAIQFVNLCILGQYFLLCEEKLAIPPPGTRKKIVQSAVKLFVAGYLRVDR